MRFYKLIMKKKLLNFQISKFIFHSKVLLSVERQGWIIYFASLASAVTANLLFALSLVPTKGRWDLDKFWCKSFCKIPKENKFLHK